MTRNLRLPMLLAVLALTALPAAHAEAATQILGLVASNGVPTPLRCEDGVCRGFFNSFCLQQERPAPALDSKYQLVPGAGLTVVARRADGSVIRLWARVWLPSALTPASPRSPPRCPRLG